MSAATDGIRRSTSSPAEELGASEPLLPASAQQPSDRQRTFLRYFTGALIDLVILGLFDEYTEQVHVHNFTNLLLASILLQLLLKWTIVAEHYVLSYFKGKAGFAWKSLKIFVAWLILFGSKFVILETLSFTFGDMVQFRGAFHGLAWLIGVVVLMVLIEELVVRFYRKLA